MPPGTRGGRRGEGIPVARRARAQRWRVERRRPPHRPRTAELKRLEADRKVANERAAGAARMDEMDKLFTEFFRGLTARVRPKLEVEASNLVRELTTDATRRWSSTTTTGSGYWTTSTTPTP
jgi:choline dehydrogenase-like flavoprotein